MEINLENFVAVKKNVYSGEENTLRINQSTISLSRDVFERLKNKDTDELLIEFKYSKEHNAILLNPVANSVIGFLFRVDPNKSSLSSPTIPIPTAVKVMHIPRGIYQPKVEDQPNIFILQQEFSDTPLPRNEEKYFDETKQQNDVEVDDIVSWPARPSKGGAFIATGKVTNVLENKNGKYCHIAPISKNWFDHYQGTYDSNRIRSAIIQVDKLIIREKNNV